MRLRTLSIGLMVSVFSGVVSGEGFDKQKAVADAKASVQSLGSALKSELIAAMTESGPVSALEVCNLEAMPVTAQVATDRNASVYRVSLKNRNPNNAPRDWEAEILKDFDSRAASGEDIATMASVSVVDHGGKKQLRFMKALPVEGACLACHGQNIAADVQAKIDDLYPADKATGYSPGQVRGAIVVVKDY